MAQFMLFLWEAPNPPRRSTEENQGVIGEYQAWGQKLREEGRMVGGQKLSDARTDPGRLLSGDSSRLSVTDGPLTETKEVIGGFYQIEAADYDEAVQVASACPHLRYGGRIELRQVDFV